MTTPWSLLVFAAFLASCGSSSPDTGAAGSCNPLAFAMLNAAGSNAKVCDATVKCIDKQCSDSAKECAGPDYQTLTYAGTCGAYLNCVKSCNCAKACVDKCQPDTIDCSSCITVKLGMGCTLKCPTEIASCGR